MTVESRSVVVRLSAETAQYIREMQKAGTVGADAMTKVERAGKGSAASMATVEKKSSSAAKALDDIGINAKTAALGGLAVIGTSALTASADFDQAMSKVQAATHETEAGMDSLRQAALDAGAETSFSATEAADGIEQLAKAGLSTQDILDGGLSGALDLAAAGNMEVADAAEAAAGALAQFKLEGDQATHVADLLAAGAGKAQGDVSDMVMALKQAGTVSAQTGLSLEETVGALSAMAEQSLLGSDAGTSFKTMLAALTPNSKKAADAMAQYNINAFDAQGNFVGMTELAGQLQAGLSGLTDEQRAMALETIFGSDAVRAASIIYDNGAEGIANWTAQVNDAGYAAETSAIMLDNLKGDVEALQGALQTAFIEGGSDSQGMLRGITQLATDTVNLTTEAEKADGVLGGLRDSALGAINPIGSLGNMYNGLKSEIFGADEKTEDLDTSTESLAQTAVTAAGGLDAQARASEGAGAAAQQTAADTEAMEKALEEARKQARDTADGFFNLGESLNDSKVSLSDWITEMAQQADALENFTVNAKKAGKNGLREGLIQDLQNAGTEGALRLKQLANASEEEIARANRAWAKGQKAIDAYVAATVKVPEDVSTTVDADTSRAMGSLREVDTYLDGLDGKTATTYVNTVRTITGPQGNAIFSQQADGSVLDFYADGGMRENHVAQIAPAGAWRIWAEPETGGEAYIPLSPSKRERSIDIWEEVGSRLGLTFERFAGGSTGSGSADRGKRRRRSSIEFDSVVDNSPSEQALAQAADAAEQFYAEQERAQREAEERAKREAEIAEAVLDGQQRAWDMATDAAQAQKDAAQQMVDSVEANMDKLGQAATAQFQSEVFGRSQRRGLWVDGAGSGWRGALEGDITGLRERSSIITELSRPGMNLSPEALETLLREADNAQIRDMLAAGEVDDYAALFAERARLTGAVQGQAGMAGYGQEYAAASAQLVMTNQKLDLLNALIAQARPITVTETVSAAALAAEVARLQALTGGF